MKEKLEYISSKTGSGQITCYNAADNLDIMKFIADNNELINKELLKSGGILLRGFSIRSISEFNKLSNIVSPNLLDYVNRSTPRTNIGGKIYTATEYPPEKSIPFHNENAYTLSWPNKILFFCAIAAKVGGETPIADSREVFKKINQDIVNKFNEKKVLYVRNYTTGIDLSWQEVFQTEDKNEVEKYCRENSISFEWHHPNNSNVKLVTKQICQATLVHPVTGETVWFNQAHLFNAFALGEKERELLISAVGKDALPRNTYYGDGSEIEPEVFVQINEAYEQERIEFTWHKGDVMILDNILMAHARNPFSGDRKIVVAMGM